MSYFFVMLIWHQPLLAQSGDIENARQIMDAPYFHASNQVVLLLKQLKRGLKR